MILFLLVIEDTFSIPGRGVVVTGIVNRGQISVKEKVEILGRGKKLTATCMGIEMDQKLFDAAEVGDEVGLLLQGVDSNDVYEGQMLVHPSSMSFVKYFSCDCYFVEKEDGKPYDITQNDTIQICFRTISYTGKFEFPTGVKRISSNDLYPLRFKLDYARPLEKGMIVAIRINEETIGVGIIKEILA